MKNSLFFKMEEAKINVRKKKDTQVILVIIYKKCNVG